MSPEPISINYRAVPTARLFHQDNSLVRGIMGPIGSGKSVACCMEIFLKCRNQIAVNGVRRSRWAVIRNTYQQLKKTTLNTWKDWFEHFCTIREGSEITATLRVPLPDGTRIDAEILFLPLDKPGDDRKLLSLELTGAWFNEVREINKRHLDAAIGRIGRYPSKRDGGFNWSGIIMDTNPPDNDHWYYRIAETERPDGWKFFRQPGALIKTPKGGFRANPMAENVNNLELGFTYYTRQVAGKDPEWIKVYLLGEYGALFDGRPVYDGMFSEAMHRSKVDLPIFKGIPIHLGWDFGLTPACVAMQLSPDGQLRVLREWMCERGGIKQFAANTVMPALANLFGGMDITGMGDPAGMQANQANSDLSCISQLNKMGLYTVEAPTNLLIPRRQAVIDFLSKTVGGNPGFILNTCCPFLRKGFMGGYQFARVQVAGQERFRDIPIKNEYSHAHDALQYGVLSYIIKKPVESVLTTTTQTRDGWGGFK